MIVTIFLVSLVAVCNAETNNTSHDVDAGEVIDQLIEFARPTLKGNDSNFAEVRGFNVNAKDYFGISNIGTVRCKAGVMRDLSTFRRVGQSILRRVNRENGVSELVLIVSMKIDELEFKFEPCSLNIFGYEAVRKTKLRVTVQDNMLSAMISVTSSKSGCESTVRKVAINKLDGIEVHVAGRSVTRAMLSVYLSLKIRTYHDKILEKIRDGVFAIASRRLNDANLCGVLKGLKYFG